MSTEKKRTSTVERRPALNMRTSTELRDRLEAAASARNISLSQEVIRRVEASFRAEESLDRESGRAATNFLVHLIRGALSAVEAKTSKEWKDDARTAALCDGAVSGVVEILVTPLLGSTTLNRLTDGQKTEEELYADLRAVGRSIGRVYAQDRLSDQVKKLDDGAWADE